MFYGLIYIHSNAFFFLYKRLCSQFIIKIVFFFFFFLNHLPFMTYHFYPASCYFWWGCGVGGIFRSNFSFSGAFNIWLGMGNFWWLWRGDPSLVHVVYLLPFHRHIAFSSTKSGWWDFYRAHLMVSACVWARGWSAPGQVLHFGWTWVYFSTNPDLVKNGNCAAVIPPWLPFWYHISYIKE